MDILVENNFDIVRSFTRFANLGAGWVMWLLLALALGLLLVAFERACLYCRTELDVPTLGRLLNEALERGDIGHAKRLVSRGLAMEERVIADGLGVWERGAHAVEQVMKSSLERERQRFERRLSYLGTVGSNAPFIGLLGTVIGIVLSFEQLSKSPKGGMAIVGAGLAEALTSTALGLLVAIPAIITFNMFRASIKRRLSNVEFLSGLLLSELGEGR